MTEAEILKKQVAVKGNMLASDQLKSSFHLDKQEQELFEQIKSYISENIEKILDELVQLIFDNPVAIKIIDESGSSIEKIRPLLNEWILGLFDADGIDLDYHQKKLGSGSQRAELDICRCLMVFGVNKLNSFLDNILGEKFKDNPDNLKRIQFIFNQRLNANLLSLFKIFSNSEFKSVEENFECFQSIIEDSSAVIFVKDLEGRYLAINRQYEDLFHINREDLVGQTDYKIFNKTLADKFRDDDKKVLKSMKPITFEEVVPQDDGEHVYTTVKYPLFDNQNHLYGIGGIALDITKRKKDELEKVVKKNPKIKNFEAENKNLNAIGQMTAAIAHEIKNPLAGIIGALKVLQEDYPKEHEHREIAEEIVHQIEYLNRAVKSLLQFSKSFDMNLEDISFLQLIEGVSKICKNDPNCKKVRIEVDEATKELEVYVDPMFMQQVFLNLVLNACHAMKGKGVIKVYSQISDDHLDIYVQDNGPGVSDSICSKIFEPFATDKSNGTGLGLFNCKKIVEAHGGSLTLEPSKKGACFKVSLKQKAL